jgi:competence protein ComEC
MRYDNFMPRVPATLLAVWLCAGSARAADPLRLYFVDVEGGQATLAVSPSGGSLLIDTGWEGFGGRDAVRIKAAAKEAGVTRLDYLLITHFHADHVGGVANLLEQLPVATFLDHGPSVESGDYPPAYAAAFARAKHQVVKPGDKIPLKDLDITVMAAASQDIDRRGEPNPHCEGLAPRPGESGENPQSVGVVIGYGRFRMADLGDLTWNRELALLCPENKIGKVDLYLTTHHGAESPKAIWAMAPRVAIMNNGARKGGSAAGWKTLMASPGLEAVWQLHFALANGGEANAPDAFIANLAENAGDGTPLKVEARADGSFTVTNPRNKFARTYPPR